MENMSQEAISFYTFLCTAMTVGFAAVTSMRLAFVCMRPGFNCSDDGELVCSYLAAGLIGAVLAYYGVSASVEFAGLLGGIAAIFASVPFCAIFWLLLIGGKRIIERIFTGLVKVF